MQQFPPPGSISRHLRAAKFKIYSNHGRIMPKFQHHLLSPSIQVQKMVEIGIRCPKIQVTQGRIKILKVHALGGINKHFTPKYLNLN